MYTETKKGTQDHDLPVVGKLSVELVRVGAERRAHATLRGDVHHQTQVLLHQGCKERYNAKIYTYRVVKDLS